MSAGPPYRKIVVHILVGGLPLCGFSSKVPSEWPPGNVWAHTFEELVGLRDPKVPCDGCGQQHWLKQGRGARP